MVAADFCVFAVVARNRYNAPASGLPLVQAEWVRRRTGIYAWSWRYGSVTWTTDRAEAQVFPLRDAVAVAARAGGWPFLVERTAECARHSIDEPLSRLVDDDKAERHQAMLARRHLD